MVATSDNDSRLKGAGPGTATSADDFCCCFCCTTLLAAVNWLLRAVNGHAAAAAASPVTVWVRDDTASALLLATREIIGSLDRVLMLTGLGLTLFGAHVRLIRACCCLCAEVFMSTLRPQVSLRIAEIRASTCATVIGVGLKGPIRAQGQAGSSDRRRGTIIA